MHRGLLVATFLLIAPGAAAQVEYYGTLGIYDDPAHTRSFGEMAPLVPKTIYVGLDLDAHPWGQFLDGLQFSIAGLDAVFLFSMAIQPTPLYVSGDVHAPIDMQNGSGGLTITWSQSILDSDVSIALLIGSAVPLPDHEFQVLRGFPPIWPEFPQPLAVWDQGLTFFRMPLIGGTYTLNPTIATESRTWSAVKSLFRSP